MKRLYYVATDLEVTRKIAEALQNAGLKSWNFHVLSKDEAGLYERRIHSGNPLHWRDLLRVGERGALIGFLIGLLSVIALFFVTDLPNEHSLFIQFSVLIVPTLFGAWLGGMVGLSTENYKIRRFHRELEKGRHLLLIDIERRFVPMVRDLMQHYPVFDAGVDKPSVMPFDRPSPI